MARLLLDTTVLIDVLRGRAAADRLRLMAYEGPPPLVCAVNVEEIWRGVRPGEIAGVRRLIGGLQIAPLGHSEGELAGRWRREFAEKGRTLSQSDCLIAAAAVGIRAKLATANLRDFPMPELELEHWPTG